MSRIRYGRSPNFIAEGSLYGDKSVAFAAQDSSTDRVDFMGIGDSNQVFSGHGWDHGFQHGLIATRQMYATGLVVIGENYGNGNGLGYGFNSGTGGQVFDPTTGGDLAIYNELAGHYANIGHHSPFPVAVGESFSAAAYNISLYVNAASGFAHDGTTRFVLEYGVSPNWSGGSHRFAVRRAVSPYTVLAATGTLSTTGASVGFVDAEVTATVTSAYADLQYGQHAGTGVTLTGPALLGYGRAIVDARGTGFSYHTLLYYGGVGMRTFANTITAQPVPWATRYFGKVRSWQFTTHRVVVTINGGLNDRNDSALSVGPSPANSSTAAGYADNLRAVIDAVEARWTANGWPLTELFFLVVPSHPVSFPDDARLVAYVEAAKGVALSRSRVLVCDLRALTNYGEMLANGWYQSSGADVNHLTQSAYETLGTRVVTALLGVT